jgi:sugar phosphate isomerase/epimerase
MKTDKAGMSRREALGALGAWAVAGRMAWAAEAGAGAKKAGIALQLYTLRDPAKKDLADTLKKAAEIGWKYVQWSGMPGLPADQIRAALDKAGLQCIAAHVGIEAFEKNFDDQVAFWKTVGAKDVAPGGMMKDCTADLAAWKKGAQRLDALGAKLRAAGMRLSFHNHTMEFGKFPDDPRARLDILMEETKPENLCAELDLAWAAAGGADPAACIRKFKGRCPVVHAKDVLIDGKKHTLKPLGQGSLTWADIFAAGKESGIEWYVYEQDSGEGTPFDYTRASYEFLSKQPL